MKPGEEISLAPCPNSSARNDRTSDLSATENDILDKQLHAPTSNTGFLDLYRFASRWDLVIIVGSTVAAVAGGAALPLFTVGILLLFGASLTWQLLFGNLASTFEDIGNNRIAYDQFYHKLTRYALYFVYLGIGELATIYVATAGFVYTGDHVVQKVRVEYLRAILRQNIAFFDTLGPGEITSRITADTNVIQDGISEKFGLALTGVSTFVTAFLIAYIKYWKLALICSSSLVALMLIMGGGSLSMLRFSRRALEFQGRGSSLAEDVLGSIQTVVAFDAQEPLARKYEAELQASQRPGVKAQMIFAIMIGALLCVMYLNYGLGFWMGSRFLVDSTSNIQAGDILTILMAIILGSYNLGNVAPNTQAISSAVAAASKLYSTIDRQSPLDVASKQGDSLFNVSGQIELHNITHAYPSRREVIVMKDLSVEIPAGRKTAFVGASGSGKSTIVGLIERFYNPISGSILLDGHDIDKLNLRWLRQQISLVSQEPKLFATTIYENIRFGLIGSSFERESEYPMRKRVEDAARMANAHVFIMALPDGYDTNIGGFPLSGGQKQRIAIARAMVKNPKILLLDEATSALDTQSEGLVQTALDKAAKGRTTISIAHRFSTIKDADNIVVLSGGSVVEQGHHQQLMDSEGLYCSMVEAQQLERKREPAHDGFLTSDEYKADSLVSFYWEHAETSHIGDSDDASDLGLKTGAKQRPVSRLSGVVPDLSSSRQDRYSLWTLIKFLASFNRPEWPLMGLGFAIAVLAGGIQPSQAVIFAKAVTTLGLPPVQYTRLRNDSNFWSLMFLMIGLVTFILYGLFGTTFAYCSEKLIYRARSQAFRVMLHQEVSFFDKEENSTGALVASLSVEAKQLAGTTGVTLGTLLIVSVNLVASLGVALILGWKLALVCVSAVPVLLLCGFLRVWVLDRLQKRAKTAYQKSASYAGEAASAIQTVASLNMEEKISASYQEQLQNQVRNDLPAIMKSSLLYASSQALPFFCMALGFWYGGTLLGHGEYSLFQFYVCFSEVIFGAQAAGTVFSQAPDMGKAKHAAAEFKQLFSNQSMDLVARRGAPVSSMRGMVEFRDVSFRYSGRMSQPILRHLSLAIKPGQFVAVVGASGSGKSTIFSLLQRFYDPMVGGIYIDGKDILSYDIISYRSHLALVSQEPALFQGTIRENVLLGSTTDVTEDALTQACTDANILDFITSLPQSFDTIVGSKGSMLSGGQKQRIAIARALIRNPKILLLDEATSALDSESEKVVQAALDAASRGRTTIAVAHRLSTIQRADIIYVLDQGAVVERGTHRELLNKRGRYHELVSLQDLG